jgi:septum formation protein
MHKLPFDRSLGDKINRLLGTRKLLLASASPRRSTILSRSGVDFSVKRCLIPETALDGLKPHQVALRLAEMKATEVTKYFPKHIVLGADTVVALKEQILGKPKDRDDAFQMLSKLSGRTHTVHTALAIEIKKLGFRRSDYETTKVRFKRLTPKDIENYIVSGEPMDKAGAYGIQGLGHFLVKSISGPLDNVVGLPLARLAKLLEELPPPLGGEEG